MQLVVTKKRLIAEDTVAVRLEAANGTLDTAAPGAHMTLGINGLTRSYTLTHGFRSGDPYEIQVLRVKDGRGGSRYIHDRLAVDDRVDGLGVANDFPLSTSLAPSIFIAGGIGITPFLSMAEALAATGRAFKVHHVVRSRARQVPIPDAILPDLFTYAEERPDFAQLLSQVDRASHLYVCGPVEMMAAVRAEAHRQGFAPRPNSRGDFRRRSRRHRPTAGGTPRTLRKVPRGAARATPARRAARTRSMAQL